MYRITLGAALLLLLMSCFCCSAGDEFHDAGFTTQEIRQCVCKRVMKAKWRCPHGLVPTTAGARQDLKKCLCKNVNKEETPNKQAFCAPQNTIVQIPL